MLKELNNWNLSGWQPNCWRMEITLELGFTPLPEVEPLAVSTPASVQKCLREHDLIPDWNCFGKSKQCEWVENREWVYETKFLRAECPAGQETVLCLEGLDSRGFVYLNDQVLGEFSNGYIQHSYLLDESELQEVNTLQVVFLTPARWLGQFGHTSRIKEFKPRYNYGWDWTNRLVQIGVYDKVYLQDKRSFDLSQIHTSTDHQAIRLMELPERDLVLELLDSSGALVQSVTIGKSDSLTWNIAGVKLWNSNGLGEQTLYKLIIRDDDASIERTVGFKSIQWKACRNAPAEADPWICCINGVDTFLRGVNWTPIRPNFADVTEEDYRQRLELYQQMGCNLLRVWGGGFLEKSIFYEICDELGLLVWQELPLSSSGPDNWPSEEPEMIDEMLLTAKDYAKRRSHHVSLLMWCGGNELQGSLEGGRIGAGKPITCAHPMMKVIQEKLAQWDPYNRFIPTSALGPRFLASKEDFGKGLHWDVHGPWLPETTEYWAGDDALFRSELGCPSASPKDILETYLSGQSLLPADASNPYWRPFWFWIQWEAYLQQSGNPNSIDAFLEWSAALQADNLALAANTCFKRFPECGGILIWMGHDSFPCTANTSIIDFWGRPKQAYHRLKEIFNNRL
jgi:beta-mannosidase